MLPLDAIQGKKLRKRTYSYCSGGAFVRLSLQISYLPAVLGRQLDVFDAPQGLRLYTAPV